MILVALTANEVYRLARVAGLAHERAVVATAVSWGESSYRPDVLGDKSRVGEPTEDGRHWGPSVGLWQIRSVQEERGTGGPRDQERLVDPTFNAASMATLSRNGADFTPWTVYRTGKYKSFLLAVREAIARDAMSTADIIRAAMADMEAWGVRVVWVDGWEERGRPYDFDPQGAVWHHTATKGYDYDYPSLGIVRDGRSDLPGPLAQFGVGRHSAAVYVIAAGYANHAGPGGWNGLAGNGVVWGTEVENDGIGEEFSPAVVRSCRLLAVALGRHTGYGPDRNCEHYEWSNAGKIDRNLHVIDGDSERREVAALVGAPTEEDELAGEAAERLDIIARRLEWIDDGKLHNVLKSQERTNELLEEIRDALKK